LPNFIFRFKHIFPNPSCGYIYFFRDF